MLKPEVAFVSFHMVLKHVIKNSNMEGNSQAVIVILIDGKYL